MTFFRLMCVCLVTCSTISFAETPKNQLLVMEKMNANDREKINEFCIALKEGITGRLNLITSENVSKKTFSDFSYLIRYKFKPGISSLFRNLKQLGADECDL